MPSCLKLINTYVPTYLKLLPAYVPLCFILVGAYVRSCLKLIGAYVPTCLKLLHAYAPAFFTCLRAYNHSQNILRLTSIPCIADFLWIICRSSHWGYSLRKGVLRNFVKFTGRHLCQRLLFNKVAGLRHSTLLKK